MEETNDSGHLPEYVGQSCDLTDLGCHFQNFGTWLIDLLLFIPRKTYELLLSSVAAVLEAIPVPDAIQSGDFMSGISPHIMFFADFAQVPAGIAIVSGAYLVRFLIRRIPFIG